MEKDFSLIQNNSYLLEILEYIVLNPQDNGTNYCIDFCIYYSYDDSKTLGFVRDIILNDPIEIEQRENDSFNPPIGLENLIIFLNNDVKLPNNQKLNKMEIKKYYTNTEFLDFLKENMPQEIIDNLLIESEKNILSIKTLSHNKKISRFKI